MPILEWRRISDTWPGFPNQKRENVKLPRRCSPVALFQSYDHGLLPESRASTRHEEIKARRWFPQDEEGCEGKRLLGQLFRLLHRTSSPHLCRGAHYHAALKCRGGAWGPPCPEWA